MASIRFAAIALYVAFSAAHSFAQPVQYSAIWSKQRTATKWFAGPEAQLKQFLPSKGILHLSAFKYREGIGYCAVTSSAVTTRSPWAHNLTRDQLNQFVNVTHRQHQLKMFCGYESGGRVFFTALVHDRASNVQRWEESLSQAEVNQLANVTLKGHAISHLHGYTIGGQTRFDVVFSKTRQQTPWEEQLTQAGLNSYLNDRYKACRVKNVSGFHVGGELRFSTHADCQDGKTIHWEESLNFAELKELDVKLRGQGFYMISLNGINQ